MTNALKLTATFLLASLIACSHVGEPRKSAEPKNGPRAQLSIGYSLLYQEADGIPKLNWLLMFKDKSEPMSQTTADIVAFYKQLSETMQRLSKEFPAMRIDVQPMSDIEAKMRKAIGADLAKDMAPIAGKSGPDFEREALLMFYDSLNEQSHLVGVMLDMEPDSGLKKFLETTKTQLDAHHAKVGTLLNRRYFTH